MPIFFITHSCIYLLLPKGKFKPNIKLAFILSSGTFIDFSIGTPNSLRATLPTFPAYRLADANILKPGQWIFNIAPQSYPYVETDALADKSKKFNGERFSTKVPIVYEEILSKRWVNNAPTLNLS